MQPGVSATSCLKSCLFFLVEPPTCDATKTQEKSDFQKAMVMHNHTHTWCYIIIPFSFPHMLKKHKTQECKGNIVFSVPTFHPNVLFFGLRLPLFLLMNRGLYGSAQRSMDPSSNGESLALSLHPLNCSPLPFFSHCQHLSVPIRGRGRKKEVIKPWLTYLVS